MSFFRLLGLIASPFLVGFGLYLMFGWTPTYGEGATNGIIAFYLGGKVLGGLMVLAALAAWAGDGLRVSASTPTAAALLKPLLRKFATWAEGRDIEEQIVSLDHQQDAALKEQTQIMQSRRQLNETQQELASAAVQLADCGDDPRAEAQWLMAHVLGSTRAKVQSQMALVETPEQVQRFRAYVARRAAGEPLAYVTGEQPFWNITLQVTPDVLIPRPDTELLVDWALERLAGQSGMQVLDACTGSGCVAISLAVNAPTAAVWASDLSAAALAVAQQNARRAGREITFLQADALELPAETPRFHLITANPPYIAEGDPHLPALRHEPLLALVSGADGLSLIRRLIVEARHRLLPGGALMLEHGFDQAERVRQLLIEAGYRRVETRRDLGGNERVTMGVRLP